MPLDTVTVGANQRQIFVVGDPTTASSQANVLAGSGDGRNLGSVYGQLTLSSTLLENSGGTFDQQRSAVGTTGVAASNTEGTKATYSCGTLGLTPVATATDFFTLVGSGSKVVRVTRVQISGIATSATSVDIQAIKRTTANSGGASTNPTVVLHDSNDSAATATPNVYSTNPTTGTGSPFRIGKLNLGATGAAGELIWDFTTRNSKGLVLRGTTQAFALNWNGASVPSGTSVDIDIEWTEE